jgi:hypothetical protein
LIAEKEKDWKIINWNKSFEIIDNQEINILSLTKDI